MREFNKKIEEALLLLQDNKPGEASVLLSSLVGSSDRTRLAASIEKALTERIDRKAETRETLKTLMSEVSWRISQGQS